MAPGEKKILVARKGRLRQRYDGEHRLVAGCVPYRMGADGHPELLMVSTPNRDDLVFPKVTDQTIQDSTRRVLRSSAADLDVRIAFFLLWQGGWEDDEDVHEAACREALEEAGVKGAINVSILTLNSL